MKKIFSIFIITLLFFTLFGLISVTSEECTPIIVNKDFLYVGETFTVFPADAKLVEHISTGNVEVVGIEGTRKVYLAKSSGTIIFKNCNDMLTIRVFPKETPFDALKNMLGLGKK